MNVSLKIAVPTIAAGLLAISSCNNVSKRAEKYMADKPYADYQQLDKQTSAMKQQSMLDSIAYRDVFNTTKAKNDSTLVAEFNKIASTVGGNYKDVVLRNKVINTSLIEQGISTKEYNEITNKSKWHDGVTKRFTILQHYADDWTYRKFFKRIGVMNDRVAQMCDSVSEIIRP